MTKNINLLKVLFYVSLCGLRFDLSGIRSRVLVDVLVDYICVLTTALHTKSCPLVALAI